MNEFVDSIKYAIDHGDGHVDYHRKALFALFIFRLLGYTIDEGTQGFTKMRFETTLKLTNKDLAVIIDTVKVMYD